jgi:hypothetical protein
MPTSNKAVVTIEDSGIFIKSTSIAFLIKLLNCSITKLILVVDK